MTHRIALTLHYTGTLFKGWQQQPAHLRTVQTTLENAIAKIAGHDISVIASGRTDSGVHALGQVVHFDTDATRSISSWVKGVNTHLPDDITVVSALEVANDFHARFDAYRRAYRYVLYNHPIRPCILDKRVGWTFMPLNVANMHDAAQLLIGKQDFSSFRSSECQAKSPIKDLYVSDVYTDNGLICFDFEAAGFLHHMVRNIVGALVFVGQGKLNTHDFKTIIDAKNRIYAPPTFMPDGLYLTKIWYPEHLGLKTPDLPAWFWGKK